MKALTQKETKQIYGGGATAQSLPNGCWACPQTYQKEDFMLAYIQEGNKVSCQMTSNLYDTGKKGKPATDWWSFDPYTLWQCAGGWGDTGNATNCAWCDL